MPDSENTLLKHSWARHTCAQNHTENTLRICCAEAECLNPKGLGHRLKVVLEWILGINESDC